MDKLLILGNNIHVDEIIGLAKKRGIYTIATDNLPVEKSPVKALADEAWDISINDYDLLEKKIIENDINAVICGASESCLAANRELCKRLNLPFFCKDRTLGIVNDKIRFKEECEKCGLRVPKNIFLTPEFNDKDIADINYPVVVKPADGSSSIGLHICYNKSELISGYMDAYEKSIIKKVVVEEYIHGEQTGFIFVLQKGTPILVTSGDDVADINNMERRIFGFSPTKHIDYYKKELFQAIVKLLKRLDCKQGVVGLQFITNSHEMVLIEMNYRLPGGKNAAEEIMCMSMLESALGRDIDTKPVLVNDKVFAYAIWLKPGRIKEIQGIDKLRQLIPNFSIQQIKHKEEQIIENTGMRQLFGFIEIMANIDNVEEYIKIINDFFHVISNTGEDMVIKYRYNNVERYAEIDMQGVEKNE